MNTTK